MHIDTADCGVPDQRPGTRQSKAVPLAMMTAARVRNLYDLMYAAYCSEALRTHSKSLDHVPLIDHNARGGEKKPFTPHEEQRYKERTQVERTNGRLKDEFGGTTVRMRGAEKVMSHLMFGLLVLTTDQLMRLFT